MMLFKKVVWPGPVRLFQKGDLIQNTTTPTQINIVLDVYEKTNGTTKTHIIRSVRYANTREGLCIGNRSRNIKLELCAGYGGLRYARYKSGDWYQVIEHVPTTEYLDFMLAAKKVEQIVGRSVVQICTSFVDKLSNGPADNKYQIEKILRDFEGVVTAWNPGGLPTTVELQEVNDDEDR